MAVGDNLFNMSQALIEAGGAPSWVPVGEMNRWAREKDSSSIWYYNDVAGSWINLNLDYVRIYNGDILIDNSSSLGDQLQALESAIEAIVLDGNHTSITRPSSTYNVAPTAGEVPNPQNGDSADVYLQVVEDLEKWVFTGGTWSRVMVLDLSPTIVNLGYTPSPTQGTITNNVGDDAIIPVVDSVNAGLMKPAQGDKVDLLTITQPVDLDDLEQDVDDLITLSGLPENSTTTGGGAGNILTDTSIKGNLNELEAAIEAIDPAIDNIADTPSVNLEVDPSDNLTAHVKRSANQDSSYDIVEEADGLKVNKKTLTAYVTHAAANAAEPPKTAYVLTVNNLESVVSDGKSAPEFRTD